MFFGLKELNKMGFSFVAPGLLPFSLNSNEDRRKVHFYIDHFGDANLNGFKDEGKVFSLLYASSHGNKEIVKEILERDIDFTITDRHGYKLEYAALYCSLVINSNLSVLSSLLDFGLNPEQKSPNGVRLIDALILPKPQIMIGDTQSKALHALLERGLVPSKEIFECNRKICTEALEKLGGSFALRKLENGREGYQVYKNLVKELSIKNSIINSL